MTYKELSLLEQWFNLRFSDPNSQQLQGIVIHDGVCGMGKTGDIIETMNSLLEKSPDSRVIYVSPLLNELHRIAGTKRNPDPKNKSGSPLRDRNNKVIYAANKKLLQRFYHPESWRGGKLTDLKRLVESNKNIVMTHHLFSLIDPETIQLIKEKNYHLIMDEEPKVFQLAVDKYIIELNKKKIKLSGEEVSTFFENGTLNADEETGIVSWNTFDGKMFYYRYDDVKKDCDKGNLILYNEEGKPILIWRQNPEVFRCFKTIHVLTYLFKESILRTYFDLYKMPYVICDRTMDEVFTPGRIHPYHKLIHFYTTKGKWLPQDKNPFSSSWYDRNLVKGNKEIPALKKRVSSFFKSKNPFPATTSSDQKLWTTFKKAKQKIEGIGYTKNFLAFNTRATNDYIKANKMAYLVDVYLPPPIQNFLKSKINAQDLNYSLSVLIQWIFRGAIRKGEPIHLFIPSLRMRKFLEDWMGQFGGEYDFSMKSLFYDRDHDPDIEVVNEYVDEDIPQEQVIKKQPGLVNLLKESGINP